MEKRCVIVSAGPVADGMALPAEFAGCPVIACDAGWKNCQRLGLVPTRVLGDFDSSERPAGDNVTVLPREKDDTDTHYAARQAVQAGYTQVLLLGALGGARMEHTLANIGTALWLTQQGVQAILLNEKSRVTVVLPGRVYTYPRQAYQYLSLFPLEGVCTGITLTGAKYPLEDAALGVNFPLGVSNEWAADTVRLQTRQGALLVIETLADR